jgi:hypothetical protein
MENLREVVPRNAQRIRQARGTDGLAAVLGDGEHRPEGVFSRLREHGTGGVKDGSRF